MKYTRNISTAGGYISLVYFIGVFQSCLANVTSNKSNGSLPCAHSIFCLSSKWSPQMVISGCLMRNPFSSRILLYAYFFTCGRLSHKYCHMCCYVDSHHAAICGRPPPQSAAQFRSRSISRYVDSSVSLPNGQVVFPQVVSNRQSSWLLEFPGVQKHACLIRIVELQLFGSSFQTQLASHALLWRLA